MPKASPRLLNNSQSQVAENCYFSSGELIALKENLKIGDAILEKAGVKKTIYRFGQEETSDLRYWFHWTTDVSVVRGSIASDVTERTYYTGDGLPKVTYSPIATTGINKTYPLNSFLLGVPRPNIDDIGITVENLGIESLVSNGTLATATTREPITLGSEGTITIMGATEAVYNGTAIKITVTGANSFNYTLPAVAVVNVASGTLEYNYGGLPQTVFYAVTYVSGLGEEGAPAISNLVNVISGQKVTLTNLPFAPAGNYNFTKKRIYKTITGNVTTSFRYVGELNIATTTYVDRVPFDKVQENIPSLNYVEPPTDLRGLISLSNGMMAGISKNEVCFSIAYLPHAWPIEYRYSLNIKIVGLGSFGNSIVVLTDGIPSVLTGSSPESFSQDEVKVGQPCLSSRSIVELLGGVMWASDEGLAFISASGFDLATKGIFDRKSWKKYNPSSIHAYRWENRYVGFYEADGVKKGFIFDPLTGDFELLGFYATAGFTDPKNGNLYLAIGDDVYLFDGDEYGMLLKWRSRIFISPKPINMAFCKLSAREYPIRISLYADGDFIHVTDVEDETPFALPSGYLASQFEIELHGHGVVQGVAIAETVDELRGSVE